MNLESADLMLVPMPREVQLLGEFVRVPREAAPLELLIGTNIEESSRQGQAYEIRILGHADAAEGRGTVELRAASLAGLRHARATLAQLRRRFGDRLPTLFLRDQPSFAVRGVMLDVSRDRVPTMAEFGRIIELLASLKFNHLQLYTEHTFAYAGHEEVWRGWSPLTPEEVRTLDDLCRSRGIALAANQNCFGHLGSWLRHERYAPLAETHGEWVFDVWPRSGPFSLCPVDPGSLALVEDLLNQLLPCFSTPLVNIGCDETFDVGYGRSREAVLARGKGAVYAEFVRSICERVASLGFGPMFWADIALTHPEALRHLPDELIALAWGYEPDAPFARWCEQIRAASERRAVWVCPGTSAWRSITGRTMERRGNIAAAARDGNAGGAHGLMICEWGDTGHHQQWPITALALANGADGAWNADHSGAFDAGAGALHAILNESRGGDVGHAATTTPSVAGDEERRHEEIGQAQALGRWLDGLGDADLPLRETCLGLARPGHHGRLRNQSALFIDLHNHRGHSSADVGALDSWEAALARVSEAERTMPTSLPELLRAELRHTLDVARLAAERATRRRRPGGLDAASRSNLAERLVAIMQEHRRLWMIRSREGGLDDSGGHYERILADLTLG